MNFRDQKIKKANFKVRFFYNPYRKKWESGLILILILIFIRIALPKLCLMCFQT